MILSSFLDLLDHPRRSGRNWVARCPAHADRSPSLSISEGTDGRILLRCWSGCTADEITAALGLSFRDLFPDEKPDPNKLRTARRQEEKSKRLRSAQMAEAALLQRAESIIERAKGIDTSKMAESQLDRLVDLVGAARLALLAEGKKELLQAVEELWTAKEIKNALAQWEEV